MNLRNINNSLNQIKTSILVVSILVQAPLAGACTVSKLTGSFSKITVDAQDSKIASDFSQNSLEISGCGAATTHLIFSRNTIFQFLNSRAQSLENTNNINLSNTCTVKNEIEGFKNLNISEYTNDLKTKNKILDECLTLSISNNLSAPIDITLNASCKLVSQNESKSSIELQGSSCAVSYKKSSVYSFKYNIKKECQNIDFLKKYEAQDVLANLMVQEAKNTEIYNPTLKKNVNFIKGEDDGPFFSRNLLLKFLPEKNSFPTSYDEVTKFNYPNVLTTQFHQGQVIMRSFGSQTKFDFEFLADNTSKVFCKNGFCTKSSNTVNPILARISVFKKDKSKNRFDKISGDYFYAPLIVPMQWSGLLETADRGLFVNMMSNLFIVSKPIVKDDTIRVMVEFIDAKDVLDDLKMLSDDDLNTDFNLVGQSDSALPSIPLMKAPSLGAKLSTLPALSLNNSSTNSLENFGIDLKAAFTHRFGKFCNDQYKCADIKPYQAFETLITEYTVGENSNGLLETKDIIVQKKSKVYDSYLKRITHFPEIVCQ